MLEVIVAIFILSSLIVYALMGGADFGGGIWNLLAFGPRAKRQREAIAEAIGPIWEANHVWLILVVVLLFTGFPAAFARIGITLHIPLSLMLIGIVLRGSAFTFRSHYGPGHGEEAGEAARTSRHWGRVFAIAGAHRAGARRLHRHLRGALAHAVRTRCRPAHPGPVRVPGRRLPDGRGAG